MAKDRARHRNNPDQYKLTARKHFLKKIHNLSLKQFDEMLAAQGGVCAICGTTKWAAYGPVVDHDHATGEVRAILCNRCNAGLGHMGDDPGRLRAAAAYLERHRKTMMEGATNEN